MLDSVQGQPQILLVVNSGPRNELSLRLEAKRVALLYRRPAQGSLREGLQLISTRACAFREVDDGIGPVVAAIPDPEAFQPGEFIERSRLPGCQTAQRDPIAWTKFGGLHPTPGSEHS